MNRNLINIESILIKNCNNEGDARKVMNHAYDYMNSLCNLLDEDSFDNQSYLKNNVFPYLALYMGLIKAGEEFPVAYDFTAKLTNIKNIEESLRTKEYKNISNFCKSEISKIASYKVINNNDMNKFTKDLNSKCFLLQKKTKEVVSDEDMKIAKNIVYDTYPNTNGEVLLYCSALNLLNTYVKQPDAKIGYFFKSFVEQVLLDSLLKYNFDNISFALKKDGKLPVFLVKINNIVFSFHNVRVDEKTEQKIINSPCHKDVKFDNIRKQMAAVTIFSEIYNFIKSH